MTTLEFKGKAQVYAHHLSVPHRPLLLDAARSYNFSTPPPKIRATMSR